MAQPNLFRYGGGELSQDALICWLVACAGRASGTFGNVASRSCVPSFGQVLRIEPVFRCSDSMARGWFPTMGRVSSPT